MGRGYEASLCWEPGSSWHPIPHRMLAPQGRGCRGLCGRGPREPSRRSSSPQDQANPGCTSTSGQKAELRRGGSSRSPRSKARSEGPGPATPLHLDLTKVGPGTEPSSQPSSPSALSLPGLRLSGARTTFSLEKGGLGCVQLQEACLFHLLPAADQDEPGGWPRGLRPLTGDTSLPPVRRPLHTTCHLPPQNQRCPGPG